MLRIVVPAYNEEARIAETIRAYSDYFGDSVLICVVANGCSDGTVAIVQQMIKSNKNLQLIEIPFAIGKGGAVRVGLMIGNEEFVGFTDADGSTPPDSFAKIAAVCGTPGTHAAIGSRWLRDSLVMSKQPLLRRSASRAFNLFTRVFFGLGFADTQCGCKVFRRSALDVVLPSLELSNFAFDVDLLYAFRRSQLVVREVPVTWTDQPDSKVRVAKIWFALLFGLLRLRMRTGPFRGLPFLKLIARSNVIEVKERFRILVVALGSDPITDETTVEVWSRRVEALGHDVNFQRARSSFSRFKLFAWYFRSANAIYDLIVDADAALPDWFYLVSTKARVGPEVFQLENVDQVLEDLPSFFGFSQLIFDKIGNSWSLMGGSPRLKIRLCDSFANVESN